MRHSKINLFLTAVLIIILYFTIPANNEWLYGKILNLNVLTELQHLDETYRKEYRYGYSYELIEDLKKKIKDSAAIVLLPPQAYLKENGVTNFVSPEPSVFYYLSGVKGVWVNSPDADNATYALNVRRRGVVSLGKIKSNTGCDSLISFWRTYLPTQ